eukprot:4440043-Pyramimonas_sp.AAC.1
MCPRRAADTRPPQEEEEEEEEEEQEHNQEQEQEQEQQQQQQGKEGGDSRFLWFCHRVAINVEALQLTSVRCES